jgi:hypothetical protein
LRLWLSRRKSSLVTVLLGALAHALLADGTIRRSNRFQPALFELALFELALLQLAPCAWGKPNAEKSWALLSAMLRMT